MVTSIDFNDNSPIEDRTRQELENRIRQELEGRVSADNSVSDNLNHTNNTVHDSGRVRSWSGTLVGYLTSAKNFTLDVLRNTKIEILAGIAAGGIIVGVATYRNEAIQNHILRIGFSETEQIEDRAAAEGLRIPAFTNYHTKSVDYYNKYFEIYNTSWENTLVGKDNTRSLAQELKRRMDPESKKYRYEIQDLKILLPQLADSLTREMDYLKEMRKEAKTAYDAFRDAWDVYNRDVTHTDSELVPVTTIDADGDISISMEWQHTTVYDYTENRYKYDEGSGLKASTSLNTIQRYHPKIYADEWILAATETHEENERAILKSRKKDFEGKTLTQEERLALVNSWITNSRLYKDLKQLEPVRASLMAECDIWQKQKYTAPASARASSRRTYDRSHPDPQELRTCENAAVACGNLIEDIDDLFQIVENSKHKLLDLNGLVDRFLAESESGKVTPTMKRLNRQIINKAIDNYEFMFPYGVPVEHARWWKVPVFALIGAILGGAAGAGVDYLGEKTNFYGRRRREDETGDNFNRTSSRSPYSPM